MNKQLGLLSFNELANAIEYAKDTINTSHEKDRQIAILSQEKINSAVNYETLNRKYKVKCKENRENEVLLERYMKDAQQHYEICPICGGDGGHEFDTEDGPNHEECGFCEAIGTVTREVFQKWKESQAPKNTVKEVAAIKSNDPDDLPF